MPKLKVEVPADLPPPRGAYSAALPCGDFVYVAGQSARDSELNIVGTTVEEQTRKTIENVAGLLSAAGSSLKEAVKATVHLSNLADFSRYDAVYAELVPEPRPVRTTVGSVLAPGVLVEIDMVAYSGND
jgi:2-iminobutanoate/2-iminopropanoate deaminase